MAPVMWITAGLAMSIVATVVAVLLLGRARARLDRLGPSDAGAITGGTPAPAPSPRRRVGGMRDAGRRAG